MVSDAASSGRKSVGSMSLGGSFSDTLNAAVNVASSAGTLMVVAAGNDTTDACGTPVSLDMMETLADGAIYMFV